MFLYFRTPQWQLVQKANVGPSSRPVRVRRCWRSGAADDRSAADSGWSGANRGHRYRLPSRRQCHLHRRRTPALAPPKPPCFRPERERPSLRWHRTARFRQKETDSRQNCTANWHLLYLHILLFSLSPSGSTTSAFRWHHGAINSHQ